MKGWEPEAEATVTSARGFRLSLCFGPVSITSTANMHQEVKPFLAFSVPSSKEPWRGSQDNTNPTASRKMSSYKPGKEQRERARGGPCKPHPRHTHLPAEAPQSALTGDACGHSRQRSHQARVPESPRPAPQSQSAGSGVGKKHFRNLLHQRSV